MREKKELKKKREKKKKTKQTSQPTSLTHLPFNRAAQQPAHLTPPARSPPRATDRWGPLSGPPSTSRRPPHPPAPPAAALPRRPLASPRQFPSLLVRRAPNRRRSSRPHPFLSPETAAHRAARHQWRPPPCPPSTASPATPPLPPPPIKRRPKDAAGAPRLAADPLRRRLFFLFESRSGFPFSSSTFQCLHLVD
jgi:hypothetical protein